MRLTITGRHMEITPALKAYLEAQADHLHDSLEPHELHVTFSTEKSRHRAEMHLREATGTYFAASETHDLRSSIDEALDHLETQARKHRDKMVAAHHGRRAQAAKQEFLFADHEEEQRSKKSRFTEY